MKSRWLAVLLMLWVAEVSAQGVTLPPVERIELDNGAVILLSEKHDVPLIGVRAILRGGAVSDPPGLDGLAGLVAGLLEKGAGERDAAEFAEAVAAVGGELSATGEREGISVSAEFLARDADLMVELLADMLQRPQLDSKEVEKLRDRSINFIRAAKDANLGALMPLYGHAFLFGEHAYGRSPDGSEASLAAIRVADVQRYYREQIGADRLIIAVAGDFDTAAMAEKLGAAFADWRTAEGLAAVVEPPPAQTGRKVLLIDKPGATQSYFWIGNRGVAAAFGERAELDIANTVFGGRFTSMLNSELRVKSGLTYGARSTLTRPSQPGSLAIYSYTKTETTVEAIDMALAVLAALKDTGLDADMLQSAKNYILGQFPPRLETASQLARTLAMMEHLELDASYIDAYGEAIASADGAAVAGVIDAVYPNADDLVFVVLGDAELIREPIARYGPLTELSISEPTFHTAAE